MSNLQECYEALKKIINWTPEPYESIEAAEAHRNFWKPQKVKTLLLAESHVYTTVEENAIEVNHDDLNTISAPKQFVRLVYCLGYGNNSLLSHQPERANGGTPAYWRLFGNAIDWPKNKEVKSFQNKIEILTTMKEQGVWLLDTCPIALAGKDSQDKEIKPNIKPKKYKELIKTSWENYTQPAIEELNPDIIMIIGKMVWNELHHLLPEDKTDWIYQPNAQKAGEHAPKNLKQRLNNLCR